MIQADAWQGPTWLAGGASWLGRGIPASQAHAQADHDARTIVVDIEQQVLQIAAASTDQKAMTAPVDHPLTTGMNSRVASPAWMWRIKVGQFGNGADPQRPFLVELGMSMVTPGL